MMEMRTNTDLQFGPDLSGLSLSYAVVAMFAPRVS
jgi:hypothetical protein